MAWLVFSYSLPAAPHSSTRVALWRRLRRLGAVSTKARVCVLPAREDCQEALQWLAQEVAQARGEALVMRVEQFEGLTDRELVEAFRRARAQDYRRVDAEIARLKKRLTARKRIAPPLRRSAEDLIGRVRRRYGEVARIDFFATPEGGRVLSRLDRLAQSLAPAEAGSEVSLARRRAADYRRKRWVTRPRPHVDRLACIWLIRRFIDPKARVRYGQGVEAGEIPFDMRQGEFGHRGNLCTFEVMTRAFGVDDPAVRAIAQIVHEIDLRDGRYVRPEATGIAAVLTGWLEAGLADADIEAHGIALFEGLYGGFSGVRRDRPASP